MAILTILAGLLLPVLGRAKSKAQGIICLNNNRQLALAWSLYAADHDDRIPGARSWEPAPGALQPDWTHGNWLSLASPEDDSNWNVNRFTKQSVLWPYTGESLGIWRCPADRSTGLDNRGAVVPRIRTFSMNCWVGGEGWDPSGSWRPRDATGWLVYLKQDAMNDPGPARTWVFLDEREDSINDGYFITDMAGYPDDPTCRKVVDFPGSYHDRTGTVSFADGHGLLQRWSDPRTMPPLVRNQNLKQNVDSANNPDVLWLQERSTRFSGTP